MNGRDEREGRSADELAGEPEELTPEQELEDEEEDLRVSGIGAKLSDRRNLVLAVLVVGGAIAGIYFLLPKLVGLDEDLESIGDAKWYWLVAAVGFNILAFAAYVALFRGVLGRERNIGTDFERRLDVRASYQITMAGLAATRIFSAAGAGGIVLTYWALRKAGMPRRQSACRMVAFIVLMYSVYVLALIVFGVLLRTGVLPGDAPAGGTIVPAVIGAVLILVAALLTLVPGDLERQLQRVGEEHRFRRLAERLATVPATAASGVRTALDYVRHPRRGALAVAGAIGFWAANIGVLWASFEAYGGDVPFAVLVQGFFVGMAANLIPSPAGGVGSVDAGMIGAFLLFGIGGGIVFPAVLTYRVIAFWLPIPPGVIAFFGLRRTVARWEQERRGYTSESKVTAEATTQ